MARFQFRELEKWFETLEREAYRADVRFECDSLSHSALIAVIAYPLEFVGIPEESPPDESLSFAIRAIEPYWCESEFRNLEIDFTENGIDFRTDDPALWTFEQMFDVICNSPVDCQKLFLNVADRMNAIASHANIIYYLDPWKRLDPPFWLGRFPETLFRHVTEALNEMNVAVFAPSDSRSEDRPVLLEIAEVLQVIAKDFEVEIPNEEDHPTWFRAR